MKTTKLYEVISSFWFLQITGWSIYMVYFYIMYIPLYGFYDLKVFVWNFCYAFEGFLLSLLLRNIYKRINYHSIPFLTLSFYVLLLSLAFAVIYYWGEKFTDLLLSDQRIKGHPINIRDFIYASLQTTFLGVCWSTLYFTIKLWKEWYFQKELTSQANEKLQTAQLQILRYQLNPHFLFNSLSSIRALIDEDVDCAKMMLTNLSDFLRYSLINKSDSMVPFNDEIDAVKCFFSIEKERYEDKLEINYNIDPVINDFLIPSFLLYPIAENALRYGLQTSSFPLRIFVNAYFSEMMLIIEIVNSGHWIKNNPPDAKNITSNGIGLENVVNRLMNNFHDKYKFTTEENDGKVTVQIQINRYLEK